MTRTGPGRRPVPSLPRAAGRRRETGRGAERNGHGRATRGPADGGAARRGLRATPGPPPTAGGDRPRDAPPAAGGGAAGRRGGAAGPGGRVHLLLRPARSSRRRCGGGTSPRTCSPAGWPPARRCSPRAGSSPAGPALRRAGRVTALAAVSASAVLPGQRPGPAGALPPHAAGGEADLADVGGHLDPHRVRPGRGRRRDRRGGRRCCPSAVCSGWPAGCCRRSGTPPGWSPPVTAPALATYTGVLLADTAVPSWHEAYPELPVDLRGQRAGQRRRRGAARRAAGAGRAGAADGGGRRGAGAVRRASGGDPPRPAQRALPAGPAGSAAARRAALTAAGVVGRAARPAQPGGRRAVRCRAAGRVGVHPVRHLLRRRRLGARPAVHGGAAARTAPSPASRRAWIFHLIGRPRPRCDRMSGGGVQAAGAPPGLQNRSGPGPGPGGFDSRPSPPHRLREMT